MDWDNFKKYMFLIHNDEINKHLTHRINGYFIILILGAIVVNALILFWFDSLNLFSSVDNRLDLMVFVLTVILVDATLSLLSFTYILAIKEDDKSSTDLEVTEIVSHKSAEEIGYLIKNSKDQLKNKSVDLKDQKKELLIYLDVIKDNIKLLTIKPEISSEKILKMDSNQNIGLNKKREIDKNSRLPVYLIEPKIMRLSEEVDNLDDNLKNGSVNQEIKIYFNEAKNLFDKIKRLEEEIVESLRILEYSMEVYNFKTLKMIGKLFFQSSISIIMGFFILGILTFLLRNDNIVEALQSFWNIPMQLIIFFATIFILDGSWSFLRAVYSFFNLYIRD